MSQFTVPDPPFRANVVTDQDGSDANASFVARMTKIWMGWFLGLKTWGDALGTSQTHSYSAGDYTHTGGGTWTVDSGDLFNYSWRLIADVLFMNVSLIHTSITGFVGAVQVALPSEVFASQPYIIAESQNFPALIVQNGTPVAGATAEVVATDSKVIVFDPAAAFAASTNATDINFSINFKVVPV